MKVTLRLLLITFILFPSALNAQDDFTGFSLNLRTGPGFALRYDMGVHLGSELSIYRGRNIYSAEYTFFEEFTIFGEEDYVTNQVALLYGKYWGKEWFRYQLQAGVGPLWGDRIVSDHYSSYVSFGIILKAGLKLLPFRFGGIGTDLQLNINPENTSLMVMLGIDLGKMINSRKQ